MKLIDMLRLTPGAVVPYAPRPRFRLRRWLQYYRAFRGIQFSPAAAMVEARVYVRAGR